MATKPTVLPEWATDGGADIVEPALGQKQDGWDVSDKPPAGWMNWLQNLLYLWIFWLDSKFTDGTSGDRIGCHGIDSTGQSSGHTGITGTSGGGSTPGVYGVGATGVGILGEGGSSGPGVQGNAGGASAGVRGSADGSAFSVGVEAAGDITNPPVAGALYIVPQAALPTAGRVGELCVVSSTQKLYICTNSTGPVWTVVGTQS